MTQMNPELAKTFGTIINRAVQERASGSGRPFMMLHLITNRCIFKCKSCLWKENNWEDVPLEDLKKFYSQAAEQGFMGTAISGGEPFLRKDLDQLVKFVNEEAKIPILLFNTGWFLEERMDDILPYVDILLLSLDAATPEGHDAIRGVDGLFERLMNGIDLVKKKFPDLPMRFNACVQKGIGEQIDDMIKLTEEKGLKISFDVITEFRHGDGGGHYSETSAGMELAELRGVCAYLLDKKREGAPVINSELYFKYFMEGKPGYKCHFPKLCMQIDGRGNIENCLNLDQPIANIREMPLKEIMELPAFKQLRADAEACCSCNSPTMVDLSNVWENPKLIFEQGGIEVA